LLLCRSRLNSERARKARKFLWSRTIRNRAAWRGDVFGPGLIPRFRPLLPHFRDCQFLVVDLVDSSSDRLRKLFSDLGYWDSTCLYGVLNHRRVEISELIKEWTLKIMQMENGELCVGERIEDALVVGTGVSLIIRNGAEFAFCIENADERAGGADTLGVPDMVDG